MRSKTLFSKVTNCLSLHIFVKRFSNVVDESTLFGKCKFTNTLNFINKDSYESIPIYRILTASGNVEGSMDFKLDKNTLRKMYINMVTLNIMDTILYESQRQGRISFYITNLGEEAVQIGSAAALTLKDIIYAQYRESGVLLWRGFKLLDFMNQCYGNYEDLGKGRQMPVHYGCKDLNFVTISSPLTTQLPQAVGAAYGQKIKRENSCVVCYFGDGAASEGDAHAAFNFAATLDCPIIFFCRNNGYAISTPIYEQYKGDGIAAKGPAYGLNTIRVDGNDVLAVYHVTQFARNFSIEERKPVLIEAMTYRVGHHSTSDDSSAYRKVEEVALWQKYSPILKFKHYLENIGYWCEGEEDSLKKSVKKEILSVFAEAEKKVKPHWKELFSDVYKDMPHHLREQMNSMEKHLKEYPEHYPLNLYNKA